MLPILCNGLHYRLIWIVFLKSRPAWDQVCKQHMYLGGRGKLEIRHILKELLQQLNHHQCEIPQDEAMSLSQLKGG